MNKLTFKSTYKNFPKLFKRWIKILKGSLILYLYNHFFKTEKYYNKYVKKYYGFTENEYAGLRTFHGISYFHFIYTINDKIVYLFLRQYFQTFNSINDDIGKEVFL